LIAAIGKEIQPSDFANYMKFHYRRLLKPSYQLKPFSYAIRRSIDHSPEGILRLEEILVSGSISEPVNTICNSISASYSTPMQFVLSACSNVIFKGDRHLHALLLHNFSGEPVPQLQLISEARQFSGYIVMIGRIQSATVFEPKYAMIVQNKDEVTIPLDLEQIPTPKEFKDAIRSLSPEQQRFAQAYRSMQLESTLFGVLIVQIKPQLEKVLKLKSDSLTKEIRLTQDLMELFIKYQIPPDLLSFEGPDNSDSNSRLNAVKGHVKNIQDMIKKSKEEEVKERKLEQSYIQPLRQSDSMDYYDEDTSSMEHNSITGGAGYGGISTASAGASRGVKAKKMSSVIFSRSILDSSSAPPPTAQMFYKSATASEVPAPPAASMPISMPMPTPSVVASTQVTSDRLVLSREKSVKPVDVANPSTNKFGEDSQEVESSVSILDYTKYPSRLDAAYERLDVDSALRPTIINPRDTWTKKHKKALLDPPSKLNISSDDLRDERNAAFDLLDAITRAGALEMDDASLHVVIAATHGFDRSIMDTIVQNNVNPIERVERSALIMASILHECKAEDLVTSTQLERVSMYSPMLFSERDETIL
jgi:hypothetical protein